MEPVSKQLKAATDLDLARSQGQWITIAELARRFKKYHPDETVLPAVACIEAEFLLLLDQIRTRQETSYNNKDSGIITTTTTTVPSIQNNHSNGSTVHLVNSIETWDLKTAADESHRHDTPESIWIPPCLELKQAEKVLQRLQELIQKHTKPPGQEPSTNDEWQAQLAKIVLARVYFEVGLYDKALGSLDKLALQMQQVHSGYGMVLLVQARVIKGTCLEMKNNISAALDAYEAAWGVYEQHPLEKGQVLWDWIEKALYRAILLQVRVQGRPRNVLRLMRGYMHLATSSWSSYWRMHKRWIVFQHYGHYLTKVFREGTHLPMTISDTPYSKSTFGKSEKQASAFEELLCLTALYRSLYTSISSKLSPKEQAEYAQKLATIFVNAHDTIGWGPISNIRRVLQFMQLAKEKTFNSLPIARYIFLALARLGSFDEALLAFKSYMTLVGVPDIDELADSNTIASDVVRQIQSKLQALSEVSDSCDTALDVLGVLNIGVKLYGHTRRDGPTAAAIADIATELLESLGLQSGHTTMNGLSIVVQTYRTHGSAYGLLASHCYDPDIRATYNAKSIASLAIAAEVENSKDTWRTYYELAVQQAQMKDTKQAIRSISQSLKLEPTHLPSWCLLVQLYSCQYRFRETLETIQASLANYYDDTMPNNVAHGLSAFTWLDGEEHGQYYYDKAESYMRLRMIQLIILEQLEGPAAVSKLYSELFISYRKLAESLGMSQARTGVQSFDQLQQMVPSESTKFNNKDPARPTSSATISANATPLPPQVLLPTPDNLQMAPKGGRPRRKSLGFLDIRRLSSSSQVSLNHSTGSITTSDTQQRAAKVRSRRLSSHDISPADPTIESKTLLLSLTLPFSIPRHRPVSTASPGSTMFIRNMRCRWNGILIELWIMYISTLIKAHCYEDASKALLEVEKLGPVNAEVWHQLGRLCSSKATNADSLSPAIDAYEKALMLDPDHVDTHIDMASTYIKLGEPELAEPLLERTVHGSGWDRPHAWYLLGNIYKDQENYEQAKRCHVYAIELCDTISLSSSFLCKLPRFI